MKTIQVGLRQQGTDKTNFTKPQLAFELNFTQENQQLDKIYAVNLLPWDDDCEIELHVWQYEESSPNLKFIAYLKPEKVHGLFQVFSVIGGKGITREALYVTDNQTEALQALENIIKREVRNLLNEETI